MAWIKRNLFFVVGGVVALILIGGAGYYLWAGWSRNSDAITQLTDVVGQIKSLIDAKPSPGTAKIDNKQIALEQDKQLRDWINEADIYFQPIPAIPDGTNVEGAQFSTALQKIVGQLQQEADAADVMVPPKFEFSFTVEKDRVTFAQPGLAPLAAQLGEVKALSEVLFAARINAIDGIQRVRVSDDDAQGPGSDYLDTSHLIITNDLSIVTPYLVTIRCFTPELSRVLSGFAMSSNAFIVKSVNIQRGEPVASGMGDNSQAPNGMPGAMPGPPGSPPFPGYPPQFQPGTPPPSAGKGGLPTVLKEQQLRVTMEVDLVKFLPKT